MAAALTKSMATSNLAAGQCGSTSNADIRQPGETSAA